MHSRNMKKKERKSYFNIVVVSNKSLQVTLVRNTGQQSVKIFTSSVTKTPHHQKYQKNRFPDTL